MNNAPEHARLLGIVHAARDALQELAALPAHDEQSLVQAYALSRISILAARQLNALLSAELLIARCTA